MLVQGHYAVMTVRKEKTLHSHSLPLVGNWNIELLETRG